MVDVIYVFCIGIESTNDVAEEQEIPQNIKNNEGTCIHYICTFMCNYYSWGNLVCIMWIYMLFNHYRDVCIHTQNTIKLINTVTKPSCKLCTYISPSYKSYHFHKEPVKCKSHLKN